MSKNSDFHTSYYKFDSPHEEDISANEEAFLVHVPDRHKAQWHHIEDLDGFFVRVYQYHQNHGFLCIFLQQCFELVQFVFVVIFATFLLVCVDYDILFANKLPPGFNRNNYTEKITLSDAVYSSSVCSSEISQNALLIMFLTIATSFWALRAVKVMFNVFRLLEIKHFYRAALHVKKDEIDDLTWHEVQQRLMLVQEEQQMCIHKQQLTELDIYNRILRFKNYMVAMVNKGLLPPRMNVPFLGDVVFLTQGLKYNIELIFFWGPRAIFANSYHMKDEYKLKSRREELAERLSSDLLWLGIFNLILSPIILLWQILYSFFSYAEVLKREPGSFGARRWSMYARLYLRHFNELPHEFQARLNRGYKPASSYMDIFTSPIMAVLAKNVAFFVGSLLAVLLALTIWDEDVLKVEHVLTALTLFSIVITICKAFIPDEHAVSCPEQLMRRVVAQVHYAPDSWRGQAHTCQVRDQFAQIFQYKAAYVLEELLSPIITPFILIFWMRNRSLEIVDFFRNFTVDIAGVGDVCSFAQLDINKHGDPKWHDTSKDDPAFSQQADDGKTELSLMHFAVTNPKWNAPQEENHFLTSLKEHAQNDATTINDVQATQNPLLASLQSLGSVDMLPSVILQQPNNSILFSGFQPQEAPSHPKHEKSSQHEKSSTSEPPHHHRVAKFHGAKASEGPVDGAREGMISSIFSQQGSLPPHTGGPLDRSLRMGGLPGAFVTDDKLREMASLEMSISALYMHELHHQRLNERHNQMMWETVPDNSDYDDSSYHGDQNQSSVILRGSNHAPAKPSTSSHQGYAAIGGLTSNDLFGRLREDESRDAGSPHTSSHSAPRQPFLSVAINEAKLEDSDKGNSSDSDAAPQEFHLPDNGYDANEASISVRIPQAPNAQYRPPEI